MQGLLVHAEEEVEGRSQTLGRGHVEKIRSPKLYDPNFEVQVPESKMYDPNFDFQTFGSRALQTSNSKVCLPSFTIQTLHSKFHDPSLVLSPTGVVPQESRAAQGRHQGLVPSQGLTVRARLMRSLWARRRLEHADGLSSYHHFSCS